MRRNFLLWTYALMVVPIWVLDVTGVATSPHSQLDTFIMISLFYLVIVTATIAEEVVGDDDE